MQSIMKDKTVIGRTAAVIFTDDSNTKVPAKVDTGADSSSVWVSDIHMSDDGVLSFVFFDKESPYYSGNRHDAIDYEARLIRSSIGHTQLRYQVPLMVLVKGQKFSAKFNLANRSRNSAPVLLGRSLLNGRLLVDVALDEFPLPKHKSSRPISYTAELKSSPREFFEKYHLNNSAGDMDI